ncbi:MAG: TAXI family TRAP transporter solute-binding subunit [Lachnospiraceae bacterium]|nr:TAXI family TRAP transporter solute-binding subunit [Lachnospiraceae bacterium]
MLGKLRRYKKVYLAIALVVIFMMATACSCSSSNNDIRLGTGGEGGTYYEYGRKISDIDPSITLKSTAGSEANLRLLDKGFVDAAIVQSDSVDITSMNCAALTGLYTEAVQLVVRNDMGINSINDLRGKRVSVGDAESGVVRNAQQLLLTAGMTFEDISVSNMSFSAAATALKEGEIDAFFCTAGAPTEAVGEAIKSQKANLIGFDDDILSRLTNLYPGYNLCVIPAGTYESQTSDVHTVGVRAIMVVDPKMNDETATRLINEIFENSSMLNSNIVTDDVIDAQHAVMSVGIPFHPAAANYLEQRGVKVAKWAGEKTKFVFGSQD